MSQAAKKPDVEFRRKLSSGHYRSYGHIYWRPFIFVLLTPWGKVIIGRKHLRKANS